MPPAKVWMEIRRIECTKSKLIKNININSIFEFTTEEKRRNTFRVEKNSLETPKT